MFGRRINIDRLEDPPVKRSFFEELETRVEDVLEGGSIEEKWAAKNAFIKTGEHDLGVMYRRRRSTDDVTTRHPHAETENNDDDEDEDENYQGQYFYQPQQHWQQQERREQQSALDQQQQQQPFYDGGTLGHHQQQHPVHPYQHDTRAFVHSEAYSEQLTEPLLQPSTSKRSHTHRPVGGASPTGSTSSGSGSSQKHGSRKKVPSSSTAVDEKHVILDDKSVVTAATE